MHSDWDRPEDHEDQEYQLPALGWEAAGFLGDPEDEDAYGEPASASESPSIELPRPRGSWDAIEAGITLAGPVPSRVSEGPSIHHISDLLGTYSSRFESLDFDAIGDDSDCDEEGGLRHDALDFLCERFHDLIAAAEARDILENERIPESGTMWVLPSWTWMHSLIDVGRKDRSRADGSRLLLPVRLTFASRAISIVPESRFAGGKKKIAINWTAVGLGHTGSGVTYVSASYAPEARTNMPEDSIWQVPIEVDAPLLSGEEIRARLEELVRQGEQVARWQLLDFFDYYVRESLLRAHASVSIELLSHFGDRRVLLDETKLDNLADVMLLGDDEHPGYVWPLVERCLKPGMFLRMEPIKYIRDSLRRDANTVVRRAIGDPHIGPKIRKVAAELNTRDLEVLIEEYRRRFPKDRLSRERAIAALHVEGDPMASWWSLFAKNEGGEPTVGH